MGFLTSKSDVGTAELSLTHHSALKAHLDLGGAAGQRPVPRRGGWEEGSQHGGSQSTQSTSAGPVSAPREAVPRVR